MEPAIHREFVPVSQTLFLFHNMTGICDWATNLQRLETDPKQLKQLSACTQGINTKEPWDSGMLAQLTALAVSFSLTRFCT